MTKPRLNSLRLLLTALALSCVACSSSTNSNSSPTLPDASPAVNSQVTLKPVYAEGETWDTYSDTWGGTDGLNRVIPVNGEVRDYRANKHIGIFYFPWFWEWSTPKVFDISKIITEDPNSMNDANHPLWGPAGSMHYWGEPLLGYYSSEKDRWVIRKHIQMLNDAGVDFLVVDETNALLWPNWDGDTSRISRRLLCDEMIRLRKMGWKTPQIVFYLPIGPDSGMFPTTPFTQYLYDELYSKAEYRDLWFMRDGKPLLLVNPNYIRDEILRSRFSYIKPKFEGYENGVMNPSEWTFRQIYRPQQYPSKPVEVSVIPAQNLAIDNDGNAKLSVMSEGSIIRGRGFRNGVNDHSLEAIHRGYNFQEQWDNAIALDPEFIHVTGWNQWTAFRLSTDPTVPGNVCSSWTYDIWWYYPQPVTFTDVFSEEFSSDIEPMKGGYGDHYYNQMLQNIRRFKGARSSPWPIQAFAKLDPNGAFSQWDDIPTQYRDHQGDIEARDYPGVGGLKYQDATGRNDFGLMKVANDEQNIYFYARTFNQISNPSNENWMTLYLKTQSSPHWNGFDFVFNRQLGKLEQATGGGFYWKVVQSLNYKVEGNEFMVTIPLAALGLQNTQDANIEFKWADNTLTSGDMNDTYLHGDVAPNARFTYRYQLRGQEH